MTRRILMKALGAATAMFALGGKALGTIGAIPAQAPFGNFQPMTGRIPMGPLDLHHVLVNTALNRTCEIIQQAGLRQGFTHIAAGSHHDMLTIAIVLSPEDSDERVLDKMETGLKSAENQLVARMLKDFEPGDFVEILWRGGIHPDEPNAITLAASIYKAVDPDLARNRLPRTLA